MGCRLVVFVRPLIHGSNLNFTVILLLLNSYDFYFLLLIAPAPQTSLFLSTSRAKSSRPPPTTCFLTNLLIQPPDLPRSTRRRFFALACFRAVVRCSFALPYNHHRHLSTPTIAALLSTLTNNDLPTCICAAVAAATSVTWGPLDCACWLIGLQL